MHYLWGGLSAWGYDCSGIVWAVYRAHGMTIPRDADPQFRHGTAVSLHALQPGDLLFYGTQRYVHHVSIYAGAGRMLEAPDSAHRVRLVPVRHGGLVGARRYAALSEPALDRVELLHHVVERGLRLRRRVEGSLRLERHALGVLDLESLPAEAREELLPRQGQPRERALVDLAVLRHDRGACPEPACGSAAT